MLEIARIFQARFDAHKANVLACRSLRQDSQNEEIVNERLLSLGSSALTRALELSALADELGLDIDGREGFLSPATDRTEKK